mgnify:CR=1 FL=1
MKKILALLIVAFITSSAFAEAELKEVCHDKMDKAGKPVMGKDGKAVQDCKKIKVHKKLEGSDPVPTKK